MEQGTKRQIRRQSQKKDAVWRPLLVDWTSYHTGIVSGFLVFSCMCSNFFAENVEPGSSIFNFGRSNQLFDANPMLIFMRPIIDGVRELSNAFKQIFSSRINHSNSRGGNKYLQHISSERKSFLPNLFSPLLFFAIQSFLVILNSVDSLVLGSLAQKVLSPCATMFR